MEGIEKIKWLKYVPHWFIEDYEMLGWIVVSAGGPHAVIMEWAQEGDPVMPPKE